MYDIHIAPGTILGVVIFVILVLHSISTHEKVEEKLRKESNYEQ